MPEDTNLLDLFALLYSGWGMRRGAVLGFAKQLRRLIDYVAGIGAGFGIYHFLGDWMAEVSHLSPNLTGVPAFFLSAGGAFVLVRTIRRKLNLVVREVAGALDGFYGALLGAVRNGVLACGGIFATGMAPGEGIRDWASEGSMIGRTLQGLFGGA